MNIHSPDMARDPSREEAEAALAVLRRWAGRATAVEVEDLDPQVQRLVPGHEEGESPLLSRSYPEGFRVERPIRMICRTCRMAHPA